MAKARFHRTLFVPSMYGQYKMLDKEIKPASRKVDSSIAFGNFINLNPPFLDTKNTGHNNRYLTLLNLWWGTSDWIQLVGPNEILALNIPEKWTNDSSDRFLRKKWFDDEGDKGLKVAHVDKDRLVTHGGLTHGLWVELGKPTDVHETAELLNEKFRNTLYFGESMAITDRPYYNADPVFAHPIFETYPSWMTSTDEMPFSQVHANDGINTIAGREALTNIHSPVRYASGVVKNVYGGLVELENENYFLNVNPMVTQKELINYLPTGWRLYVEKMPVVDKREIMDKVGEKK